MWSWSRPQAAERDAGVVTLRDESAETWLQRRYRQLPQVLAGVRFLV